MKWLCVCLLAGCAALPADHTAEISTPDYDAGDCAQKPAARGSLRDAACFAFSQAVKPLHFYSFSRLRLVGTVQKEGSFLTKVPYRSQVFTTGRIVYVDCHLNIRGDEQWLRVPRQSNGQRR